MGVCQKKERGSGHQIVNNNIEIVYNVGLPFSVRNPTFYLTGNIWCILQQIQFKHCNLHINQKLYY